MANLTSDQAIKLSDNFYFLGRAIGDFRYKNWDQLSYSENKELSDFQHYILSAGEDILAQATTLIMDEVATSLEQINTISEEISGTIQTLTNIQKGLNVASAIVNLGVSILNRDPKEIGRSIKVVHETWKGE